MNDAHGPGERAAAAYEWAAGLVGLARRLIADGTDVDLSPIRPAIRDLCSVIRELPAAQAKEWINYMLDLQHELAALGHDLAVRPPTGGADATRGDRRDDAVTSTHEEEPDPCR